MDVYSSSGHTSPEDAAQFITVSDPVQHSEGMNKYTSYRVDVRPPPQQNDNPNNTNPDDVFQNAGYSAVLRRYSDFFWLYERLHKERSGAIIPPIPEKQAVSRFSASFIEERRKHLERFVRRVAVHPELYDAPCLETFLRADDVTFQAAKNAKGSNSDAMMMSMSMSVNYSSSSYPAATPPKKDGIKKWFAEAKTSIAGDLVRSPDDDLFVEIDRYIDGLEKQMKNVQLQASGLVKKGKEIANGLFEFGLAFNVLGQSEADDLGHSLTKMGMAADELSAVSMEHSEKEM
jgi:sorting nexin-1/2